jgi:hypothetical protein
LGIFYEKKKKKLVRKNYISTSRQGLPFMSKKKSFVHRQMATKGTGRMAAAANIQPKALANGG